MNWDCCMVDTALEHGASMIHQVKVDISYAIINIIEFLTLPTFAFRHFIDSVQSYPIYFNLRENDYV